MPREQIPTQPREYIPVTVTAQAAEAVTNFLISVYYGFKDKLWHAIANFKSKAFEPRRQICGDLQSQRLKYDFFTMINF